MTLQRNITQIIAIVFLSMLLTACGGGGSSDVVSTDTDNTTDTDANEVKQGVFVDAEVTGLTYITSSGQSGRLEEGVFNYVDGDSVTFYLGGMALTTLIGNDVVSVLQASNGQDLAAFLMALDSDGNAENGINLTQEVVDTFNNAVGFTSEQIDLDSADFQAQFKALTGKDLPPKHIAHNHAKASVAMRSLEDSNSLLYDYYTADIDNRVSAAYYGDLRDDVISRLQSSVAHRINLYTYRYIVKTDISLQIALGLDKLGQIGRQHEIVVGASEEASKLFNAVWLGVNAGIDQPFKDGGKEGLKYIGQKTVDDVSGVITGAMFDDVEETIPVFGPFAKRALSMADSCIQADPKDGKKPTVRERAETASQCAAEMTQQAVATINDTAAALRYEFALQDINRQLVLDELLGAYYVAGRNWQWVMQRYGVETDGSLVTLSDDQFEVLLYAIAESALAKEHSVLNYVFEPSVDFDGDDVRAVRKMFANADFEVIQYASRLMNKFGLDRGYDPVKNIVSAGSVELNKVEINDDGTLEACYTVSNNTVRNLTVDAHYLLAEVSENDVVEKEFSHIAYSRARAVEQCTILAKDIETAGMFLVDLTVDLSVGAQKIDTFQLSNVVIRRPKLAIRSNFLIPDIRSIDAYVDEHENQPDYGYADAKFKLLTLVVNVPDWNDDEDKFLHDWKQVNGPINAEDISAQLDKINVGLFTLPITAKGCYAFEYTLTSKISGVSESKTVGVDLDNGGASCNGKPVSPTIQSIDVSNTPMNTVTNFVLTGKHFKEGMQAYIQGANCPASSRIRQSDTSYTFTCSHDSEANLRLVAENSDGTLISSNNISVSFYQDQVQGTAISFDYPIGNRGYANGNIATMLEGINSEKNTPYALKTVTQDNYVRQAPASSDWYNFQDVGSFYGGTFGVHPGEDWNLGSGNTDAGEPVYAVADGKVVLIRSTFSTYTKGAWTIVIEHALANNNKVYSVYSHVTANNQSAGDVVANKALMSVKAGDIVTKGQQIGRLAHGNAMSLIPTSHLHFEMRTQNPTADLWKDDNGWGYYSHDKTRNHTSMTAGQIGSAMNLMHDEGIIDPSDFIDQHRYTAEQLGNMRFDAITPANAQPGTTQVFTISGSNLPASIAMALDNSPCRAPYDMTSTSVKIECDVPQTQGDIRFYVAVNSAGVTLAGAEGLVVNLTADLSAIPQNLTVTQTEAGALLKWDAVAGAVNYTPHASLTADGTFVSALSGSAIAATEYLIPATSFATQKTYHFAVKADDGELSEKVAFTWQDSVLASLTATAKDAEVELSWGSSSPSQTLHVAKGSFHSLAIENYSVLDGYHSLPVVNSTALSHVSTISGLDNSVKYYFILTVTSNGAERVHSNEVSSTPNAVAAVTGKLNDTGITLCGDYAYDGGSGNHSNSESCANGTDADGDPIPAGQDGHYATGKDGSKGMSFTKVAGYEDKCVLDNHTGLMWEVKQGGNDIEGDEGLHDSDDRYSWYNADSTSNGGYNGVEDNVASACTGYAAGANNSSHYCNTQAYVARVNEQSWCGYSDWRLPNKNELISIVDYSRSLPSINLDYFPNTKSLGYRTSTPHSDHITKSRYVSFDLGIDTADGKTQLLPVRLVRDADN